MILNVEIDDEVENWLDRVSTDDGVTKEELVYNIIWDAYNGATQND